MMGSILLNTQTDSEGMQNFRRRATSHLEVVKNEKNESLNDPLITFSTSSLDDAYPLDPPLKYVL